MNVNYTDVKVISDMKGRIFVMLIHTFSLQFPFLSFLAGIQILQFFVPDNCQGSSPKESVFGRACSSCKGCGVCRTEGETLRGIKGQVREPTSSIPISSRAA